MILKGLAAFMQGIGTVLRFLWQFKPSPFVWRLIRAYGVTIVLVFAYILLHLPFSYIRADTGGATTSIPHLADIVAVWLISNIAALLLGQERRQSRTHSIVLVASLIVIIVFLLTSYELIYRVQNPGSTLIDTIEQNAWTRPFIFVDGYYRIPSNLNRVFSSHSLTAQGILFSFLSSANTFRELNWYWVIVPWVDPQWTGLANPSAIPLNLILSGLLLIVGLAVRVVVPIGTLSLGQILGLSRLSREATTQRRKTPTPSRIRVGRLQRVVRQVLLLSLVAILLSLSIPVILGVVNSPSIDWKVLASAPENPLQVQASTIDTRTGVLYAGTTAGVFRSTDSGANWQATSAGLTNKNVQTLMIDERTNILYAGTVGGVFRSTDGGTSWQPASEGLTNKDVRALVLDGRNGILYAGTAFGVFRSTDGGMSWQPVSAISQNPPIDTAFVVAKDVQFVPNNLIIATGTTVQWKNDDPMNHTVTSGVPGTSDQSSIITSLFRAGVVSSGGTFTFTFSDPGTFPYFSELDSTMSGTITVGVAENVRTLLRLM